jgi:transglutaminase-like putative cysteine protease
VSGYLETLPPPGQVKMVGADASHAWVSVWCGEAGWQDLDPTNDLRPGERHFTLGWGRDFADVSPVHGVAIGSGTHRLSVAVDVNAVTSELESSRTKEAGQP